MPEFCEGCGRARRAGQGLCYPCHARYCRWMHNRPPPTGAENDRIVVVTAIFHIGFLSILETEQELMRLRAERRYFIGEPSRSKVFDDASRVPVPIDCTAARVAPEPKDTP